MHDDYNSIANEFSATRQYTWPELLALEKYLIQDSVILDFGCGNGRLVDWFKHYNIKYTGLDISEELLKLARQKYPQATFTSYDGQRLPAFAQAFDQIWSVAVLQQIPTSRRRQALLRALHKNLKPNGLFIATTWNLWQKKYFWPLAQSFLKKIFCPWRWEFGDAFIPWKATGQQTYQRYYHVFTPYTWQKEFRQAGFTVVDFVPLYRGKKLVGWAVVAKK